ncbi:hypothetical protein CMU14_13350 [Elizabethkingia anophelis]|nr:hypothetical protein [Elizabethkingia anophelis]
MAVNSELIETIKASQLPKLANPATGDFIHAQGDNLSTTSLQFFIEKINNGYNGTMSNSLVIPSTGYYRYKVVDPGTYTNVSPNITVTQQEISENFVVIAVRDGVSMKELDPKPSVSAKTTFDQNDNINPSTMKAAYNASDQTFDKAFAIKAGDSGSVILGYGTAQNNTSSYAAVRVNNTPAPSDGSVTNISINITPSFDLQPVLFVVLEKINTNDFVCVSTHTVSVTSTGVNNILLGSPIPMKKGQYLGIGINDRLFFSFDGAGESFGFDGYNMFTPGHTQTRGNIYNQNWCYDYTFEKIGLTGDEAVNILIDIKKNGVGGQPEGTIDLAYEYKVSASNTAEENTARINDAILAAESTKKEIIFPNGIIKHNGIAYKQGVVMRGKGINNTTLLNEGGTFSIYDLDTNNSNNWVNGALIQDMTIDGGNVANIGLNIRNHFYISVIRVVFRRFKQYCVRMEGVLTPYFSMVKLQQSKNGLYATYSASSSLGYMQDNMQRYTMCYFAELENLCADFDRGANIVFDQCNFENSGVLNDNNTGGIRATNLCPYGEGTGLVVQNGWSEGIRGSFFNISNSGGKHNISNQIIMRQGNGAGDGGTAVLNNGCKVLINGTTYIVGYQHGVETNGGQTYVDGFSDILNHSETNGGQFKVSQYA